MLDARRVLAFQVAVLLLVLSCTSAPSPEANRASPTPSASPAWSADQPPPDFPKFSVEPRPKRAYKPGEVARFRVTLEQPAEPETLLQLTSSLNIPYGGPIPQDRQWQAPVPNAWKLLECQNPGAQQSVDGLAVPIPTGANEITLLLLIRPTQSFQSSWSIPKEIAWNGQGLLVSTPAVRSYLSWEERQARAAWHDRREYKPRTNIPTKSWLELRFPLAPPGPDDGLPSWSARKRDTSSASTVR